VCASLEEAHRQISFPLLIDFLLFSVGLVSWPALPSGGVVFFTSQPFRFVFRGLGLVLFFFCMCIISRFSVSLSLYHFFFDISLFFSPLALRMVLLHLVPRFAASAPPPYTAFFPADLRSMVVLSLLAYSTSSSWECACPRRYRVLGRDLSKT